MSLGLQGLGNLLGSDWELPALHIWHSIAFRTYLNLITSSLCPFTDELGILQLFFSPVPFIICENSSVSVGPKMSRFSISPSLRLCILYTTALSLVPCCLVCSQILQFFRLDVLGRVAISKEHTIALIVPAIVCLCACDFVFWWHLSLRVDD